MTESELKGRVKRAAKRFFGEDTEVQDNGKLDFGEIVFQFNTRINFKAATVCLQLVRPGFNEWEAWVEGSETRVVSGEGPEDAFPRLKEAFPLAV